MHSETASTQALLPRERAPISIPAVSWNPNVCSAQRMLVWLRMLGAGASRTLSFSLDMCTSNIFSAFLHSNRSPVPTLHAPWMDFYYKNYAPMAHSAAHSARSGTNEIWSAWTEIVAKFDRKQLRREFSPQHYHLKKGGEHKQYISDSVGHPMYSF